MEMRMAIRMAIGITMAMAMAMEMEMEMEMGMGMGMGSTHLSITWALSTRDKQHVRYPESLKAVIAKFTRA